MSTKIYIDWQANDVLWNEEIREWENVYYIIYDLGGARDPKRILTFSKTLLKCLQIMKTTIKVRKFWGILNPCTRKLDSKKTYSRKQKFQKKFDGE